MNDTRGRCSYCYLDAGRENVKACSRCRMVRYCSRECQKAAWPNHKKCCNDDVYKHLEGNPTGTEALNLLNRWTQEWRDAIQTWSLWALNLRNQPDDFLSKHIFCIELEKRVNIKEPRKQFRMLKGGIMTRKRVLSIIIDMKCSARAIENFKVDMRGNNTVQTMIIAGDLVKFLWYGKRDPVSGQPISLKDLDEDPSHAELFAEFWEQAMIDVVQKGDPALTHEYPKTVVFNMLPNLKTTVSRPNWSN